MLGIKLGTYIEKQFWQATKDVSVSQKGIFQVFLFRKQNQIIFSR